MSRATSRSAHLAWLVVLLTGSPALASAQMIDTTDPCFARIFGTDASSTLFTTGSWNNRDDLAWAAFRIRLASGQMLMEATDAKAAMASGSTAITPADLEKLRGLNRCLPWLRRQLQLIEDQMKKLGISSLKIPEDRRQVEREAFMREVREELAKTERLLNEILKAR